MTMTSRFLSSPGPRTAAGLSLALLLAACGGGGSDSPSSVTPAADDASAASAADADSTASSSVAALPEAPTAGTAPADAATDAGDERAQAQALTTTTVPTVTATCGLPDFQAAALTRINQYRARGASCRTAGTFGPATPLAWNARLIQAATGHSQDMATRNYFSHTSLDGRTFVDRINATGYLWSTLGENIAAGQTTVNAVVDGWMASDGHCRNLMNPNFRELGLACVASSTSRYRTYWTLDLGRPR